MQTSITGVKLDGTGALTQTAQALEFAATTTVTINVTVTGQNGVPINLIGQALVLSVRTSTYYNATQILSLQATIDNAAAGTAHFTIPNTAFATARGAYVYDVTLIAANGATDQIVPVGSLYITDSSYVPGQAITPLASQQPIGLGPQGLTGPPGFGGILANNFPGSDIGAQINAACASLPTGGTVVVLDGDYVQTTRVIITDGITVRLGKGTYSNSMPSGAPHWQLKDNTRLIGSGWATKIMAQVMTTGQSNVITDFVSATDNSLVGNTNLVVEDIQFIRNPASTTAGVQSAAVQFGNVKNARVSRCYFNGCEGYGVFQASSSATGNHGDGFVIEDCLFENITTQHCGVINCANWSIRNNVFRPTTATANYTIIDCESNTQNDILRNWRISGNIFDFKTSAIFNPGSMLQVIGGSGPPTVQPYKGVYGGRATYGVISDNVCVSGDFSTTSSYFGQGIQLVNCDEVEVANNVVFGASVPIGISSCDSLHIHGNTTGYGKNNDAWHILITNSFDCEITDNKCMEHFGANWSTPNLAEQGTSDYNVFKNNRIGFYPYTDPVATGGRYAKVTLLGAHSRVYDTVLNSSAGVISADARLVGTTAELRALDIPGARATGVPAVVVLGGHSAQADGGWSVWYYDTASTLTDNDITVVKPSNASVQWNGIGRWLRAPSQLRLTTTQRNALVLTATDVGLQIWNTITTQVETWNGTTWTAGGGGTQNGTTTATHLVYASAPNTLGDTGWSWDSVNKKLTGASPGYVIDSDGLSLTGGTNPINLGPTTAHMVGFSPTNVSPNAADRDLALGGAGNRRWNGLWNGGRLSSGYTEQTGISYIVGVEDCTVNMSNTAARTVTLYAANAVLQGTELRIKDGAGTAGTANITITAAGVDTIDGAASFVINTNRGKVVLVSDGVSKWIVVG